MAVLAYYKWRRKYLVSLIIINKTIKNITYSYICTSNTIQLVINYCIVNYINECMQTEDKSNSLSLLLILKLFLHTNNIAMHFISKRNVR